LIGKDNIPFHTIILPSLLLATKADYNLPWGVSSTEFLQFRGARFSKSHKVGIWIDEALELFPADYWRYFLLSTRPETKDTDFSWEIFIEKVNADLNDTLGNFIHRTLTFISQNFADSVPTPRNLEANDKETLRSVESKAEKVAQSLEKCKLQSALRNIIDISRLGNKYFNDKEPWNLIKTNRQKAANTLYIAVQIVKTLAITLNPFIPFTAEKISTLINLPSGFRSRDWTQATKHLPPGHKVERSKPLFTKIEINAKELQGKLENNRSETACP
jgi:methionyl-tRNA synthetase